MQLTSAHRGQSVRSTYLFNIINPINANLHTVTHSLKNMVQVHRGGHTLSQPYKLKHYEYRNVIHITYKPIFTYICQVKLQGLREEVGQHKHLHFLSPPPLISFHPSPSFSLPGFFQVLLTQLQVSQVGLPLWWSSSVCGCVFVQVIEAEEVGFARERWIPLDSERHSIYRLLSFNGKFTFQSKWLTWTVLSAPVKQIS